MYHSSANSTLIPTIRTHALVAELTTAESISASSQNSPDFEDAPLRPFHLRVAIGCAGGYFSDGYGLGIIGIALSAATPHLRLTPVWEGLLGGGSLAGLFVGALLTGSTADRVGRRPVFIHTMALLAISSLAQGLVTAPWQLLILRLILGLSLGADYVVSQAMLTEFSLRRLRGRMLGSLQIAWVLGYVSAYFVGYLLVDAGINSWRWMLMSSAAPALLILPLRATLPESPLWLISRGRYSEASEIVRRCVAANITLPRGLAARPVQQEAWRQLFSRTWRRRTLIGCIVYTCQVIPYFALGTFVPMVMIALRIQGSYRAGLAYNACLVIGAVLGVLIVDRISRRHFLIGSFTIAAATMAALSWRADWSPSNIVILFAVFACALSAGAILDSVYLSELFPTELRASGIGLVVAASRIGSASATFLLPIVVSQWGVRPALLCCVWVLALGGIACLLWAPETRHLCLVGYGAIDQRRDLT